MAFLKNLIAVTTTVVLAFALVGAGFLACIAPPVTHVLANLFSDDVTSPFSRSQLVCVADATRDYSFGAHDKPALYKAIYDVDLELRQSIVMGNASLPIGFPPLDDVKDPSSAEQVGAAFDGASEMYCYSAETMSHLDDCYNLARASYVALAIAGIVLLAGVIAGGVLGGKRTVGRMLRSAGVAVIVALVALGIFAAVDFTRFFATFHGLFFSQGSWVFPYDSLLICALPTEFWTGMGVVWLVSAVLLSILCIIVGSKVTK